MPAPTAQPPDIDKTRQYVSGATRRLTIGDRTFTTGEIDITLTHDGQGATFTSTHWNLTQASFYEITPGDPVHITLGWDGDTERVFTGVVTAKEAGKRGADHKYTVRGRSRGATAVRQRVTASFKDVTPGEIIRSLAGDLDLDVGTLGPTVVPDSDIGDPIVLDGYWQLRRTRRVEAWLDALADRVSRETGRQYEWYTDRGALSFHAKRHLPPEGVKMTTADTILSMQPHHGATTQTDATQPMRFDAYVQPALSRTAHLQIAHTTGGKARRQGGHVPARAQPSSRDGDGAVVAYRCAEYSFETGTTVGHHQCRAVVVPAGAVYDHTEPGEQPGAIT